MQLRVWSKAGGPKGLYYGALGYKLYLRVQNKCIHL